MIEETGALVVHILWSRRGGVKYKVHSCGPEELTREDAVRALCSAADSVRGGGADYCHIDDMYQGDW